MRKFHRLLILLMIVPGYSPAQSIFSPLQNGTGLRNYITTTRGMGMGATGLASMDSTSLNAYNIASWRNINNTKINISMRYSYVTTHFSQQDFSSSTARFNGLQLAVPIKKNRWVFGVSITPYSLVNFNYILKYPLGDQTYEETAFYEGNIARTQLNLAWSLNRKIGVAASLNYFFGNIQDRYYLTFNNSAISDNFYKIEYQFRGPGLGLSADIQPWESLLIAGFIDFNTRLNYDRIYKSPISLNVEKTENKATLPLFWGIGSYFQLGTQWNMSADIIYQNWSRGLKLGSVPNNLEDFYQVGMGIEHSHSAKRTRKLYNKLDTRLGFSYGTTGYLLGGNSIQEYSGSLGLGIPFFKGNARIDLALIAGIRGNQDKTLAEEKFIRLLISLNAGELWFQKLR